MKNTQPSKHNRTVGVLILAVLLLSGCASPPEIERNEQGDLIPYANLETAWSFPWVENGEFEIVDDTHIRIEYWTGDKSECSRNDADVVETPETVTVTLLAGYLPDTDKLCKNEDQIRDMGATKESIIVETESPIGNRQIIDGHTPD